MYLEKCYVFKVSAFPWNSLGDLSITSVLILNRVTLQQGSILWLHILYPNFWHLHTRNALQKISSVGRLFISHKALDLGLNPWRICWRPVMCLPLYKFLNNTWFSFLLFVNVSHTINIFWSRSFPFANSSKILPLPPFFFLRNKNRNWKSKQTRASKTKKMLSRPHAQE